ncbi:hypothetical protein DID80_08440 [Candidatus Marinamargulisbacteria bacterium SCGC AAA071-K20]|nr:hypothetical protein DID80_08440 [Candidatus Marinamargulisbacteria bacterium SCGC AAA071-K20]
MTVESVYGGSIPSAFDYEVVQVLLKYRQGNRKDDSSRETFVCTVWGIAKELGITYKNKKGVPSLSKNASNRIKESISRLKKTQYELLNIYNTKDPKATGKDRYKKMQRIQFSILDSVSIDEDMFKPSDKRFCIKFSQTFVQSIETKYHYTQNIKQLESIKRSAAKRLFEIMVFKSKKERKMIFSYGEMALAIPLNSGRKNRILINKYLSELKDDAKAIRNFAPDIEKDKFSVEFISDLEKNQQTEDIVIEALPKATAISLFDSVGSDKLIEILIKKYGISKVVSLELVAEYKDQILENIKYVDQQLSIKTIENIPGYVVNAIKNDYKIVETKSEPKVNDQQRKDTIKLAEVTNKENEKDNMKATRLKDKLSALTDEKKKSYREKALKNLVTKGIGLTGSDDFDNILIHSEMMTILDGELT